MISEPDFEAEKSCSNFKIWPWNGHRRFAYDLIRFVNPKRFVELGTYWGTSFFAFCQAVKDFHLGTECIAIDTWKGDGHTGPYDPKALETFSRISREVFGEINIRPLELTFQEASPL
ncbi:MAG: class I SAM-dependent methyltransferase, partial [Pseudomonadota bacterium]